MIYGGDYMNLYIYDYNIVFWCKHIDNEEKDKGIVLANNMKDAFEKLRKYYLMEGEDFDTINLELRDIDPINENYFVIPKEV